MPEQQIIGDSRCSVSHRNPDSDRIGENVREHTRQQSQRPIQILLACSGIGRVSRGYEVSFEQLFDQLQSGDKYIVYLAQGVKPHQDRHRICPLYFTNASLLARCLAKIPTLRNYSAEEISFAFGLIPFLMSHRVDIIMYSQSWLGIGLFHIRRLFGFRYKLLFSNGGPSGPAGYQGRCDFVQQKLPWVYEQARDLGFPEGRMAVVPNGFCLGANAPTNGTERASARQMLGIPQDKRLILSVAALNRYAKRVDYIIREAAPLILDGTHVLLCLGQEDAETEGIRFEFSELFQRDRLWFKSVKPEEMSSYYRAADVFVSASLYEGFGRGIVEALSFGLPCLLHDHPGFRTLAGEHAEYIDMSQAGALTSALRAEARQTRPLVEGTAAHNYVLDRYDWQKVLSQYEEMFQKCLKIERI